MKNRIMLKILVEMCFYFISNEVQKEFVYLLILSWIDR